MRALLVLLTACSTSTAIAPAPSPPASPPAPVPVPVPVPDDSDGHLESATVQGDGIRVDVSWTTMTGTTHVASSLVVTTSGGKLELIGHPEQGDDPPLIEQIEKLGPDRWLLLGWTSYGAGMQTDHAWIVDATPRVVDSLQWTTDRAHAGIAIDPNQQPIRIGIPLPPAGNLHDESEWLLVHGKTSSTLAQVQKLRASEANPLTVRAYTPPFQASASERGWKRYVWFGVNASFEQIR